MILQTEMMCVSHLNDIISFSSFYTNSIFTDKWNNIFLKVFITLIFSTCFRFHFRWAVVKCFFTLLIVLIPYFLLISIVQTKRQWWGHAGSYTCDLIKFAMQNCTNCLYLYYLSAYQHIEIDIVATPKNRYSLQNL